MTERLHQRPAAAGLTVAVLVAAAALVTTGSPAAARPQEVGTSGGTMVLTFDDLPHQGSSATFDAADRFDLASLASMNDDLVAALTAAGVPAIGFVNEQKLLGPDGELSPERAALLETWLAAGLELGNHSYSHPSLHRTDLEAFQRDVLRGDEVTSALAARHGMPTPRFFRHPYLHTGRDAETKAAVEAFLAEHGYRVAPVTIDNSEWIFAKAYALALADDAGLAARVRAEYLDYMMAKTSYYEDQSRKLLGRDLPQILLLHDNRLNADAVGALIERLRKRGYTFVPLEEALKDAAFERSDGYFGPAGISWIQRWALAEGHGGEFFAGEPRTAQWVLDLAEVESE